MRESTRHADTPGSACAAGVWGVSFRLPVWAAMSRSVHYRGSRPVHLRMRRCARPGNTGKGVHMGTYIAKDATGTRALDVTGNARRREITTHCGCGNCQGTLLVDYDTAQKLLAEAAVNGAAVITFADFRRGK